MTVSYHLATSIDGLSVSNAKTTLGIGPGANVLAASYTGSDTPGTGDNTLSDGESRVWYDGDTSYLITNIGGVYFGIEIHAPPQGDGPHIYLTPPSDSTSYPGEEDHILPDGAYEVWTPEDMEPVLVVNDDGDYYVTPITEDPDIQLPYVGDDEPGTGDNLLPCDSYRIWISGGNYYLLHRDSDCVYHNLATMRRMVDNTYMYIDVSGTPTYPVTFGGSPIRPYNDNEDIITLRRVLKGIYMMGSWSEELGRFDDEDRHQVTITEDFYIGITQITQHQWEQVMGTTPSIHVGPYRPVENISYHDLRGLNDWPTDLHTVDEASFIGKLQAKTGVTIDLPTEGQWEYAARAGSSFSYSNGTNCLVPDGEDTNLNPLAVYEYNRNASEHAIVGTKLPNSWYLYDVHGNVMEWCLDWYEASLGLFPVTDPTGPVTGTDRVLRGGSWDCDPQCCRLAARREYEPDGYGASGGVRIATHGDYEYAVINILGGQGAGSWPVRYLAAAPADLLTNDLYRSTQIIFRRIRPGTFMMGSPSGELGRYDNESHREVTISSEYWISVFQLTQGQVDKVKSSHYMFPFNPSEYPGKLRPVESISYDTIRGSVKLWPQDGYDKSEESIAGILELRTGLIIDLPTEAQWEYACRAGTTTSLNDGTNITNIVSCPNLDALGRYNYNGGSTGQHANVGTYTPNDWGLYDCHGNVLEWCLDYYTPNLGTDPATDPAGPTVPDEDGTRVVKGGGWSHDARVCRSGMRGTIVPTAESSLIGCRLVIIPS